MNSRLFGIGLIVGSIVQVVAARLLTHGIVEGTESADVSPEVTYATILASGAFPLTLVVASTMLVIGVACVVASRDGMRVITHR